MAILNKIKSFFTTIRSFYPLELIFGNIKYNLVSLLYWFILFAIVSDNYASNFGVPFLFLSPEYLGEVNHWGFILLGFSFGGFSIGFLTYSYIKLGPRYPFLQLSLVHFLDSVLTTHLYPLFL